LAKIDRDYAPVSDNYKDCCIAVVIDNFLHCYSQHPETAVISDILIHSYRF
jgi:hypothetical protein